MKTLKFILVLCYVLAAFLTAQAQNSDQQKILLFVEKNNGNISTILFKDSEIVLLKDVITVKTPTETIQFDYDEVDNFYFQLKSGTSIEKAVNSNIEVVLDDVGTLHISGESPLWNITIYGISGQLLKKVKTDDTETSINISALTKGIYLVKVKEKVFKIVK